MHFPLSSGGKFRTSLLLRSTQIVGQTTDESLSLYIIHRIRFSHAYRTKFVFCIVVSLKALHENGMNEVFTLRCTVLFTIWHWLLAIGPDFLPDQIMNSWMYGTSAWQHIRRLQSQIVYLLAGLSGPLRCMAIASPTELSRQLPWLSNR